MVSSVDDVAAAVLETVGPTTTMGLQKLVYYCQAWHLARHGEPLFADAVEAWKDGPVVRSLYARHHGERKVAGWPEGDADRLDDLAWDTVFDVVRRYGALSAETLSELTHLEAPWMVARRGLPPGASSRNIIPTQHMQDYYGRQMLPASDAVRDAVASSRAEGLTVDERVEKLAFAVAEGTTSVDDAVAEALAQWAERD